MICAEMVNSDWDAHYMNRCYFYPGRDCPGWERGTKCFRIGDVIPEKEEWARCNMDGKPIHPGDQKVIDEFKEYLKGKNADKGE